MLDDFGERPLELRTLQADRRRFHGKCLRAKGFHLKAVALEFLGNARKNHHLFRLQLHQHGHQQALALNALDLAVTQDLFKKHSFVCNMLIDDPQAVVAGGQNERFPELAERFERAEVVEIGGGLLGFDQGGCRCGIVCRKLLSRLDLGCNDSRRERRLG